MSKMLKSSHSFSIECHAILKDFFDLKVKFGITTCQNFEALEGKCANTKEYVIFNSSSCFSFRLFPVKAVVV